ncbi:MAG: pantoate--beta-alanine ligase [Bacteroidota bacterium]
MRVFYKIADLERFLEEGKLEGKTIGFVPTMGALHEGHISLVSKSKSLTDLTVVSIFVNPTQFNNQEDFEKYPIKTESDLKFLEENSCDAVFIPAKEEIYAPDYISPEINIGILEDVLEGKFRPGHFKGVIQVVYRLFQIVKPNKAFFGLKDYQQLAVIKKMTDEFKLPIEIVPCTTIREKDGLAMSSRNLRLNQVERLEALFIYETLILAKNLAVKYSPSETKKIIEDLYEESSLKLEYFEFIDGSSFEKLSNSWEENAVACVVAYVGEVRLIDNMQI